MKIPTASKVLHISALSLVLGLASGYASANDPSKERADNGAQKSQMEREADSHQNGTHTPPRDPDLESTTRSGDETQPGADDTEPAGTDATRSVPGAPEAGTDPATEPGQDAN
ncbi:hypothetical protein [Halopseudomonas pelagia]|uniref:Uncharacterized protein n=1 Tax=Halopseudomonas pelagia TaxID=553151 RepID=A0AA91Z6S6_9GAMM|nr:hypothetical protein [Halopseudomonas pelagia]PCC99870.1 hypothetical protein CO192_08610 [Halopseudomonas pelagia]QFY56268.1 hypothetical protein EAO82_07785 [Halopseudomonas pelagia]